MATESKTPSGTSTAGAASAVGSSPKPATSTPKPSVEGEEESRVFTSDELKKFAGGLKPGEVGWVELDDEGEPCSAATKDAPPPGKTAARVIGGHPTKLEEITTVSGAPLTKCMNPEPNYLDPGFLQRNPPEGSTQLPSEENIQARLKERETAYTKPQESAKHK